MHDRERDPLERLLGDALEAVDPVPSGLSDAAKSLRGFINFDASLAELVETEALTVRDPDMSHLVYQWPDGLVLTVQANVVSDQVRLTGLFAPEGIVSASIETRSSGPIDLELAEGTFEAAIDAAMVYRIRAHRPDGIYVTPWHFAEPQ